MASSLTHYGAEGLQFINADYTLTLSRLPQGPYLGLAALTHYSHAGVATGVATHRRRTRPDRQRRRQRVVEPGFRPAAPLARLEHHDGNLAVGPALVVVEVGVHLHQLRPQPCPLSRIGRDGVHRATVGSRSRRTCPGWPPGCGTTAGVQARPPCDATIITSAPSSMYSSGVTNTLPDLRPRCSSSSVGTGLRKPAPMRHLPPILPPVRR